MRTRKYDGRSTMGERMRCGRATLLPRCSILVLSFLAAGCTTAGALTHKLMGPPPVPAQYTPEKEPMLVLVENYRNPSAALSDAQRLEDRINEQITQYKIAPLTDPAKLDALRNQGGFSTMTIPAVGRACGAKQVLYVNVRKFSVEGTVGAEMLKGTADMSVRVVDVESGSNRWPVDTTGSPVAIETPWLRQAPDANEGTLREQMASRAADYIVKLFRKHGTEDDEVEQAVQ